MENTRVNIYKAGMIATCLLIIFLITGCVNNYSDENAILDLEVNQANEQFAANEDESVTDEKKGTTEQNILNDIAVGYEGEWYRTNVASYQWAKIKISNWKEGESFDVTVLANYGDYGGPIEGTATFVEKDMAVLYDENVKEFLQNYEGNYGIYFQFTENSIIVTHDSNVRLWFGGNGIATAEGTYIQDEPEYTNCTNVGKIFAESELKSIQELLGNNYKPLFVNIIELGEIKEYGIDNGRLWEAYRPPHSSEWCDILIYNDGRIYIEGYSYGSGTKEFYTNSEDIEMPNVELLKK